MPLIARTSSEAPIMNFTPSVAVIKRPIKSKPNFQINSLADDEIANDVVDEKIGPTRKLP